MSCRPPGRGGRVGVDGRLRKDDRWQEFTGTRSAAAWTAEAIARVEGWRACAGREGEGAVGDDRPDHRGADRPGTEQARGGWGRARSATRSSTRIRAIGHGWRMGEHLRADDGEHPAQDKQLGSSRGHAVTRRRRRTSSKRARRGPLVLGGDHCSVRSIAGVVRVKPKTAIVWFDARGLQYEGDDAVGEHPRDGVRERDGCGGRTCVGGAVSPNHAKSDRGRALDVGRGGTLKRSGSRVHDARDRQVQDEGGSRTR